MAFAPVNLIVDPKYVDPEDIEVVTGDTILFLNDTNYLFTVVIKNADTVFVTDSKTLIYDVPPGGVVKTPKIKANPELPLQYEVYIYIDDEIIPSEAPPKIIIGS
jgi:hypothetical protein